MMKERLLACADLERLFSRLAEQATVMVPAREESGAVAITPWDPEKPVTLDYHNFLQSAKAFFLPQNQTLLRFSGPQPKEPELPQSAVILFGVRPCDARALTLLDRVFLDGDRTDPYYAGLREKTTVIALACTRPMASCFCSSVGGGPADPTGADVLAVELAEDLLVTPHSDRGERLLTEASDMFREAGETVVEESRERMRGVESQLVRVRTEDSARRLRAAFDLPLWEEAGLKCLGCGACSFLCPTCHCFDMTDEVRGGVGLRIRTWDCCAYPLFTLQGSGHNPRPTPRERWRQRVMHKFRYAPESLGVSFCVGCGRCIRSCPVALDLRTALKDAGA